MDNKTSLEEIKRRVKKFCEECDWDQFHHAKDLAMVISIEASKLLEQF